MSDQKYPAPPIFDAIIELRLLHPFGTRDLERVQAAMGKGYANHEVTEEVQVQVHLDHGSARTSLSNPNPVHVFSNSDQTDFARAETKKLHWSRLAPYEGWSPFSERVFSDLNRLPKKIGLPALERIGLRYRNRIDVPRDEAKMFRYEDYLEVNLALPSLLDPIANYQWSITRIFPDENLGATVSSTTQSSPIPDTLGVILDIDVFCESDLPVNISSLASRLLLMRDRKNDIFEACVSDIARKAFQ